MKFFLKKNYILLAILYVAAFLRLYNLDWDQNAHLHPDERFLTLVGIAMKMPASFIQYLNPAVSTFNPTNIGYQYYVYGTFPVILNKLIAVWFTLDNYDPFTIQGRALSALADIIVVFLIYKLLQIFEGSYGFNKSIKYIGAFLYAIAVLPIQLSHFFTVDTFLNLFLFASFYMVVRFNVTGRLTDAAFSAIFLGLATSSKATSVYMVPLLGFFLVSFVWKKHFPDITFFKKRLFDRKNTTFINLCNYATVIGVVYGIITYLSTRLTDPYLFQNSNFLDPRISTLFITNLKSLDYYSSPAAWYPPSVQWIHKTPVLFSIENLIFFGLGVPFALISFVGIGMVIKKMRTAEWIAIIVWCIGFFLYQSAQFVQTMRYFIFLYPFFAIFAAFGFESITRQWKVIYRCVFMLLILIWPLMFFSIYTKPMTRVAASDWIYKNVPSGSVLLDEYWDDPLPLQTVPTFGKQYVGLEMPVFDPDSPTKWATMDAMLKRGNYLILSSNRGWGSIPTVPERYPIMTKFYSNLLSGKTNYVKVADFTSYPSLKYLGIPFTIPDDWAEEAFTVYDHPHVMIFENMKNSN